MKKMPTVDFLARVAKETPLEFEVVSICACDYVKTAIDCIGFADKSAVRAAGNRFRAEYEFLVVATKARKFCPIREIGPFEIVNFLIR